MNVSKPKKMATTTSSLVETQLKKTMHCQRCGEPDHIKNDPNCLKKKKALHIEKSKPKAKMIKIENKSKKKQLKYTYCIKFNYNKDNFYTNNVFLLQTTCFRL